MFATNAVRGVVARRCSPLGFHDLHQGLIRVRYAWRARRENHWLALVATPLAMTAAALLGLWWTWPLMLFVSYGWTPNDSKAWIFVAQQAGFGTGWAYAGIGYLTIVGHDLMVFGLVWALVPAVLSAGSALYRRDQGGAASPLW